MPEGDEGEGQEFNFIIGPDQMAGVWANWAQVTHSEHEFTLDFVRLDPNQPKTGIVVARVAVSPLFIMQLISALQANWQRYAEKAMPKEVRGEHKPEDTDANGQGAEG